MIFVSIFGCGAGECIEAVSKEQAAEIRLESIAGLDAKAIKQIFSSKAKTIATCRPGKIPDAKRKEILLAAIASGAAYVDVEVEASDGYKQEIVSAAKKAGCKVIVSFHDQEKTPVREEMEQIIRWCFDSGADIAKIACMAKSQRDCARLLGLLDRQEKLAVVAMGPEGSKARVMAKALGSQIAYACYKKGKESASGQMTKEEFSRALDALSID
ncbi:MAG: type I 3-dehydroquinate dehydratase [Candidatus Micrarchaeia archaeon]